MVAAGLESVFVSHPVDGEYDTFGRGEGVASFGYGSRFFGFVAHLLLRSAFFYFDAVFTLESVSNQRAVNRS